MSQVRHHPSKQSTTIPANTRDERIHADRQSPQETSPEENQRRKRRSRGIFLLEIRGRRATPMDQTTSTSRRKVLCPGVRKRLAREGSWCLSRVGTVLLRVESEMLLASGVLSTSSGNKEPFKDGYGRTDGSFPAPQGIAGIARELLARAAHFPRPYRRPSMIALPAGGECSSANPQREYLERESKPRAISSEILQNFLRRGERPSSFS